MLNQVLGKRVSTENAKAIEYSLSVNNFGEPAVMTNQDAIAVKLIELLLLKPGTYPTKPNMGVGLVENYRYQFFDDLTDLQLVIQEQIQTYLPEYQTTNIDLSANEELKQLMISITIDDVTYALVLDADANTLSIL